MASQGKHTPGPWAVEWPEEDGSLAMIEGPIVRGAVGQLVAEVLSIGLDGSSGHYDVHANADARLIAAAPDLLEALTGLLGEVEGLMGDSDGVAGLHLNGDLAPWSELDAGGRYERLSSLPAARAAIAKATGEEAPHA